MPTTPDFAFGSNDDTVVPVTQLGPLTLLPRPVEPLQGFGGGHVPPVHPEPDVWVHNWLPHEAKFEFGTLAAAAQALESALQYGCVPQP